MSSTAKSLYTIKIDSKNKRVKVLDQRELPYRVVKKELKDWMQAIEAISKMTVRGAPLIGVTGAAALALATKKSVDDNFLKRAVGEICAARPTAVNLRFALDLILKDLLIVAPECRERMAWKLAQDYYDREEDCCRRIAGFGSQIIRLKAAQINRPVKILTHCNAGWLATVKYGTALAGIYMAHENGVEQEIFVDETRPRLQGLLTAWELNNAGIDTVLLADNAGGFLMKNKDIDLIIVGADRIAANGDTANKVGTYLKALAAKANNIPFYVAAPISTFDWSLKDGSQIPVEFRSEEEIRVISGENQKGKRKRLWIASKNQKALNPAFDITDADLITGFITEKGVVKPSELAGLRDECDE